MENVKCKKVNMFECEIPLYYSKHKYSIGRYVRERERERERDLSFVIVIMRFECTVKDDGGPWSLFGILLLYLWQG